LVANETFNARQWPDQKQKRRGDPLLLSSRLQGGEKIRKKSVVGKLKDSAAQPGKGRLRVVEILAKKSFPQINRKKKRQKNKTGGFCILGAKKKLYED